MSAPMQGRVQGELPPDAAWQTPAAPIVDAAAAAPPALPVLPSATERLEQSRERLRQYFDSRRPHARRASASAPGESPPWLEKLRGNPLFEGVAEAIGGWWTHHPLHHVFAIGETALREGVAPLARRHPIALVAAAVAVGALLYRTRLLRRLLKPALFAGLTTQIAMRVIERIPLSSVFDVFSRFRGPVAGEDVAPAAARPSTPSPLDSGSSSREAPAVAPTSVHEAASMTRH